MKRVIWKYALRLGTNVIEMPVKAELLTVQMQRDTICLWALVNPDIAMEQRLIEVVGTGNPIPEPYAVRRYIGSVQLDEFVWHVFERGTR